MRPNIFSKKEREARKRVIESKEDRIRRQQETEEENRILEIRRQQEEELERRRRGEVNLIVDPDLPSDILARQEIANRPPETSRTYLAFMSKYGQKNNPQNKMQEEIVIVPGYQTGRYPETFFEGNMGNLEYTRGERAMAIGRRRAIERTRDDINEGKQGKFLRDIVHGYSHGRVRGVDKKRRYLSDIAQESGILQNPTITRQIAEGAIAAATQRQRNSRGRGINPNARAALGRYRVAYNSAKQQLAARYGGIPRKGSTEKKIFTAEARQLAKQIYRSGNITYM